MLVILNIIATYLLVSFAAGTAVGMLLKRARCRSQGISWAEDTRQQDEAQMEYFRRS